MAKQGRTRKGGKAKVLIKKRLSSLPASYEVKKKKGTKQGQIRYSAPAVPKKGGGFKKQSSIRIKPTGKMKEEIFYRGPEKGGPKGFGKKGKVTTRITPAGRKVQTVTGKSLTKKLKRTLTDKITGAGKDKARRLKRKHMFRRRPSKKLNK
tara:strand:+ start:32 stop:484 length:453 start_codon:yes stop_codon:yes gene_type:complete